MALGGGCPWDCPFGELGQFEKVLKAKRGVFGLLLDCRGRNSSTAGSVIPWLSSLEVKRAAVEFGDLTR